MPVIYYNSKKSWFNSAILTDWFLAYVVPAVWKNQKEVLTLAANDVQAVIILDNAPAHPSEEKLVRRVGAIKVFYLPPNTTSFIQPMDQGVISAIKRHYIRRYLNEVLGVIEDDETETDVDNRGERTLDKIKNYNILLLFTTSQQHGKIIKYLSSQTLRTS